MIALSLTQPNYTIFKDIIYVAISKHRGVLNL